MLNVADDGETLLTVGGDQFPGPSLVGPDPCANFMAARVHDERPAQDGVNSGTVA